MNLCSYCKVSVNLWALPIDHNHTQPRALRLILSKSGVGIICFELLDLLKMRLELYRPHGADLEKQEWRFSKVVAILMFDAWVTDTDRLIRIGTTIVC